MIDGPTPLHNIGAPAPGTRKTLLAEAIAWATLGRAATAMVEGRDQDEWRKRITSRLLDAPAVVLIDNLRRRLDAAAVSAALTADVWEDRQLGASQQVRVPVRCLWLCTGNNPAFSNEIARRTVQIRLDPKSDRPWQRTGFRHPDLRGWMRAQRAEIVEASLTLGRAWLAAGRPGGSATLGTYESWSRVMGGVLEVAGVTGLLEGLDAFYDESDAEGLAWRGFVARWHETFADRAVGVSDLYPLVAPTDGDPLDLGLGDGSERSQKTRLGGHLRGMRDRRFGSLAVVRAGEKQGAALFRLIEVTA